MDGQMFAQVGIAFVAGITGMNIFITFIRLCVEENKKYSIMDKERQKKVHISFLKSKKKYTVLGADNRTA